MATDRNGYSYMGERLPGPLVSTPNSSRIDEETMCRAPSNFPGPTGNMSMLDAGSYVDSSQIPMSGGVPYTIGQASLVRIPIPGTDGLAIELRPRGFIPSGGSTSTLFFQDSTGKRHLRLDYGYNVKTNTIDYHWNQKGTYANFGVTGHSAAGRAGQIVYSTAKYFKYAGRVLGIAGVAIDAVSIVQASKPLRRASEVVAGWAGAWAGCKVIGAGGAAIGTTGSVFGIAVGGIVGCIIGGASGYVGGSMLAGEVYDWVEGTFFTPLPEVAMP